MKKMLVLAVIAVTLLGAGHGFASEVTNVELSYIDSSTVARINVEGAVSFNHQMEVARDGKPFRVIVDILSATHKLGANNFMSLPNCVVRGIRTSQFAVTPEAVVRVVFDMEDQQIYRIESDDLGITLYFAEKPDRQFAAWSSAAAVASAREAKTQKAVAKAEQPAQVPIAAVTEKPVEKSPAELNQSIKSDRVASLEPEPKKADKPVATTEKRPTVKATALTESDSESLYGPFVDKSMMEAEEPAGKVPAASNVPPQEVASVTVETAEQTETKTKPALKSVVDKAATQPAVQPVAKQDTLVAAQTETEENAPASQRTTSRFRRTPTESKKMRGTLVAEFPKRLVIKYKANQHRDPFYTLLDESKTTNSPVEKQAPNVEGLKLVGVIEAGMQDNRALFEDKEGVGYILKTGDKVQKGYVLRVESDRVYFQIFEYGWSRTVALHLES